VTQELINEIFDRQSAGFERCYEALGIADDRERSWSALVLAINGVMEQIADLESDVSRLHGDKMDLMMKYVFVPGGGGERR
jgi:hypothetical protein